MKNNIYDITIIGGGIIGLSIALLLNNNIKILILDKNNIKNNKYFRDFSINQLSKKVLNSILDIPINTNNYPYFKEIFIFYKKHNITFKKSNNKILSWLVNENDIYNKLINIIKKKKNIKFLYGKFLYSKTYKNYIEIFYKEKDKIQNSNIISTLLIGSDGKNSAVRKNIENTIIHHIFDQVSLYCNITMSIKHDYIAKQFFFSLGQIALLPKKNFFQYSLIYNIKKNNFYNFNKDSIIKSIKNNVENNYTGNVIKVCDLKLSHTFPLELKYIKKYFSNRIVLIGDAAHTIHPLVGQGINLGFHDIYCLSKIINFSYITKRDIGHYNNLYYYQKEVKKNNNIISFSSYIINYFFQEQNKFIEFNKSFFLSCFNKQQTIKEKIINLALGKNY